MSSAYTIEDVTFCYNSKICLRVKALEVREGEVTALVGPNGAGKTTLLHLLAFVESPASGSIRFFEQSVTDHNKLACQRRVGLLLQNPYLFHASVLSNILWGLRIRGIKGDRARKAALEALDKVGLSGFEQRHARSLSGGESQRVALARCLVLEPEVLLLDEPANHLDAESVQRTKEMVLELNRKHGRTVVLATHNLPDAKTMASSIIHIFQGRVVPGSPDNLFLGRLSDCGSRFDTGRIEIRLPAPARSGSHITVDPTKIAVSQTQPEVTPANTFNGRVVSLSADNGVVTVSVEAGERFRIDSSWDTDNLSRLHLGQGVWITLKTDGITVF